MIQLLKNLFGMGTKTDFKELVKNGAQVIDVRTRQEFQGGHIRGAVNIPLHELAGNLSKLKKDKPLITCCASGMRSSSAKGLLESKGYTVYNGGGWNSLQRKLAS